MRHVAHPVVVVTTSTSDAPTDAPSPANSPNPSAFDDSYAATLSSLTTVTLGPPAIVTFNLRQPSRTLDALLARGLFRAHILRANADGAALAAAFVDGEHGAALQGLDERGFGVRMERFRCAQRGDGWAPSFGRGSLFAFDCEVLQDKVTVVGDHAVVFAAVRWAPEMDGVREAEGQSSLLYYFRDYGLAGRLPAAQAVQVAALNEKTPAAPKA
jgi:flavin reductase (DIM6/NTAB) family NADH-FMN oxidoreductase RutF